MPMITFVMPLPTDPRINRRVSAALQLGIPCEVFAFDRPSFKNRLPGDGAVPVHPLGFVRHGKYLSRIPAMLRAVYRLVRARRTLERSSVIYCFGPDCLSVTTAALALLRLRKPLVVYEVADVREALSAANPVGAILRRIERAMLTRVDRIVVTSPKYSDAYYVAMQHRDPRTISVLENKMFPPVPDPAPGPLWDGHRPIVFGYFGLLRFQEGWDALMSLARRYPDRVRVYIRGYQMGLENFDRDVALPNVEYGGTYVSPDDLADIYGRIDALWAVYEPSQHRNLAWAIANRFYEAVHYRVPLIATAGSYLGQRVFADATGWVVDRATPEDAEWLLRNLTPDAFRVVRQRCEALPRDFAVGDRELLDFVRSLMDEAARKMQFLRPRERSADDAPAFASTTTAD